MIIVPHERKRHLHAQFLKALAFSPLVGLIGHRQVGKTTLLNQVCHKYHVLDVLAERQAAESNPQQYLQKRAGTWVALDECQVVPALFPELKEWVRTHKKPGQFVLSGSVRFTSREAIQESLTGRISTLELLPFSVRELMQQPLSDVCVRALEAVNLSFLPRDLAQIPEFRKVGDQVDLSLERGGLPGVCFIREAKARTQRIEDQLRTILDRDLRMVKKILVPLVDIRNVLGALARMQGQALDMTQLKKETGVSVPTLKKLIAAFEATFLIRTVRIEGSTMRHTVYFEDLAEWQALAETTATPLERLAHLAFVDIRTQFAYRQGDATRHFQYRTRSGAFVPVCFGNAQGVLGILPIASPDEAGRHSGTMRSFLSAYANAKLLLVHRKKVAPTLIQPRACVVPIEAVL